jgi:FLVCR family MFS transporter 7
MDNKSEEKSDDSFLLDSTQQEEDLIIGQPINSNLVTDRNERDMATVNVTPPVQPAYKLYPIRYVMLIALIVLNISNGMMWLTYSPIPQYTAEFYGITTDDVDWFSNSYFIASLVVGFISIAVLDICGLRIAVLCGVVFNLVGSVIRYISTLPFITCSPIFPAAGFTTAIIGQILTAFAQPFFLYAPAKLANTWFGIKERGLCTDLASIG